MTTTLRDVARDLGMEWGPDHPLFQYVMTLQKTTFTLEDMKKGYAEYLTEWKSKEDGYGEIKKLKEENEKLKKVNDNWASVMLTATQKLENKISDLEDDYEELENSYDELKDENENLKYNEDVEDKPPTEDSITMTEIELEKLLDKRYWEGYTEGEKEGKKERKKSKSPPKVKVKITDKKKAQPKTFIGDFKIKNIASFKVCEGDVRNTKGVITLRFKYRDGGKDPHYSNKICEYCPQYAYANNPQVKEFLDNSKCYQKANVIQNSTKTLPKNWGLREDDDFVVYEEGERPDARLQKMWGRKTENL
jgi:hypothetical protein